MMASDDPLEIGLGILRRSKRQSRRTVIPGQDPPFAHALAKHSDVVGADGYLYKCGLQVSEPHAELLAYLLGKATVPHYFQ